MSTPDPKMTLVPTGITVGLAIFAMMLSLGSFIPMPDAERSLSLMGLVFLIHVIAIPMGFVIGGWVMHQVNGDHINWRNSVSLGLLISCVWMLWKMGSGV